MGAEAATRNGCRPRPSSETADESYIVGDDTRQAASAVRLENGVNASVKMDTA